MIPFNVAILVSLVLDGYEGLRVYNYKSCHVIEPTVENDFDDGCLADYDLISITDPKAFEFSNNLNPDQLECYVQIFFLKDRETVEARKAADRSNGHN